MLGLTVPTDPAWARLALADLDAVLVDHAHCELKAATNAMSLIARHGADLEVAARLTAIAQEEMRHFDQVLGMLRARGLSLGAPPVDTYAAELRAAIAALPRKVRVRGEPVTAPPAVDRFVVCALIEARSCERFKTLCDAMGREDDVFAFYTDLFEAEARHYREFRDLAVRTAGPGGQELVDARFAEAAAAEGVITGRLATRSGRAAIHG